MWKFDAHFIIKYYVNEKEKEKQNKIMSELSRHDFRWDNQDCTKIPSFCTLTLNNPMPNDIYFGIDMKWCISWIEMCIILIWFLLKPLVDFIINAVKYKNRKVSSIWHCDNVSSAWCTMSSNKILRIRWELDKLQRCILIIDYKKHTNVRNVF